MVEICVGVEPSVMVDLEVVVDLVVVEICVVESVDGVKYESVSNIVSVETVVWLLLMQGGFAKCGQVHTDNIS